MFKKTICFDFDGVLSTYESGWQGADVTNDPPVYGMRTLIEILRSDYKIVVNSARCAQPGGKEAVEKWLKKWGIEVDEVTPNKPAAFIYVDDRAICFNGDAEHLLNQIRKFKPWMEKKK